MAKLLITLKKSFIGRTDKQIATAKGLGLTKVGQTVEHDDNPSIRGSIHKIDFMLDVQESK
ncbi:MAG: 50S ribosomal protein L30 [Peptoniphilaceae bacterium]|nr:50S ribosomal protein L30 [Peptoniphilaceae bacterium]MDD7434396.1 50S ribosomal protein L30 [Peptoniphilaceae bacterium]MDY3076388.1 50S ribosomal protein L30 [Peptoniphilaceae bacterium]MDY4197118.1 50S ribosomal protein L30 [Peptoniphilaceae bacterium]